MIVMIDDPYLLVRAASLYVTVMLTGAIWMGRRPTRCAVAGAVMGAGASRKLTAVRWGLGANIAAAWIVTIPSAALIAWVAFAILHTAGLRG